MAAAYALVTKVMNETDYPVEDDDQGMADLSVEHFLMVGHYRAAQQITTNTAAGTGRDLRQEWIHYRALFAACSARPALSGASARQLRKAA